MLDDVRTVDATANTCKDSARGGNVQQQESIQWALGILAALMHAAGYVLYNIQTSRKTSEPHIVTWGVGAIVSILSAATFKAITGIPQAMQAIVGMVGSTATFAINVWACRFEKTDPMNRRTQILRQLRGLLSWNFALCLAAIVVWKVFQSASFANLIVLGIIALALKPMYEKVYANPRAEHPTAWIIWTAAYAVNATNNVVGWNGNLMSVISPSALLLMHLTIAFLSSESRRRSFSPLTR